MIFHTVTAVLFLLQVLGVITVSWWLVLAPSLVGLCISIIFTLLAVWLVWKGQL
jgi:hypothetical protein